MDNSKVQKFFEAKHAVFDKKIALRNAMFDLMALNKQAYAALFDTIDNGINEHDVIEIGKKYRISRFSNEDVCKFIDNIVDNVLGGINDSLCVTSLDICYFPTLCGTYPVNALANGSFALNLCDIAEKYFFCVHIPVKDVIDCDINEIICHQMSTYIGMYVVEMNIHSYSFKKEICRSFDSHDVSKAIEMCLSGKFDDIDNAHSAIRNFMQ